MWTIDNIVLPLPMDMILPLGFISPLDVNLKAMVTKLSCCFRLILIRRRRTWQGLQKQIGHHWHGIAEKLSTWKAWCNAWDTGCSRRIPIRIINGHFRTLKWRHVSTISQAIVCGDIPWNLALKNRTYIGLTCGRYLQLMLLKGPLAIEQQPHFFHT